MNTTTLYCVWAYRYGNPGGYNFPVGIFTTYEEALQKAKDHKTYRGGKYDHKIFPLPVGKAFDAEECKPLLGLPVTRPEDLVPPSTFRWETEEGESGVEPTLIEAAISAEKSTDTTYKIYTQTLIVGEE
jgi:hypothetical protein